MTSNLGILPPDLENVSYKCRIWYDDGRKMKELLPKILQVVSKYYPDMVVKECSALDFYLKTQQGVDIEINLKSSKLDDLLKVLESQDQNLIKEYSFIPPGSRLYHTAIILKDETTSIEISLYPKTIECKLLPRLLKTRFQRLSSKDFPSVEIKWQSKENVEKMNDLIEELKNI